MIVYADTSALVKRYVKEAGSQETIALMGGATVVATAMIARAEGSAALARAVRLGVLADAGGRRARQRFRREWADLLQIAVTAALVERADALAWAYQLRGYDAVHLAAALTWREAAGENVVLATFDRDLWQAAAQAGFEVWPAQLAG